MQFLCVISMKTPIVIITGYLGAGKTTLLRHIINSTKDRKIAILMNEFGDIGIDGEVIRGSAIDVVELSGGCVCCSMTGEFEAAIKEIIEKAKPELIIVETTGVAEPEAIVGDITENIPDVRLDCVVAIVDADSVLRFPVIGHTGRVQIEIADIILLNKIDLAEDNIEDVRNKIIEINEKALIVKAVHCKVPVDFILDTKVEHKVKEKEERSHVSEEGIGHFVYTSGKTMLLEKIMQVFDDLPSDVIRAKGFVVTEEGPLLVNYVFGRFDYEEFEAKRTELVFIGKNMDKHEQELTEKLKACEL